MNITGTIELFCNTCYFNFMLLIIIILEYASKLQSTANANCLEFIYATK